MEFGSRSRGTSISHLLSSAIRAHGHPADAYEVVQRAQHLLLSYKGEKYDFVDSNGISVEVVNQHVGPLGESVGSFTEHELAIVAGSLREGASRRRGTHQSLPEPSSWIAWRQVDTKESRSRSKILFTITTKTEPFETPPLRFITEDRHNEFVESLVTRGPADTAAIRHDLGIKRSSFGLEGYLQQLYEKNPARYTGNSTALSTLSASNVTSVAISGVC